MEKTHFDSKPIPVVWVLSTDSDTRRLIGLNLHQRGFNALIPPSPTDWRTLSIPPCLIILELEPFIDQEWEIVRALRGDPNTGRVPLALLASAAPRPRQMAAIEPARWIAKPISMGNLIKIVRETFSWYEASLAHATSRISTGEC